MMAAPIKPQIATSRGKHRVESAAFITHAERDYF
jgi:hypothetical protein